MEIGAKEPDEIIIERLKPQRPNHCCELIYTVFFQKSFFLYFILFLVYLVLNFLVFFYMLLKSLVKYNSALYILVGDDR